MKVNFIKNFRFSVLLFLIVGMLSFYPASVLTMQPTFAAAKTEMAGMVHAATNSIPVQDTKNCLNFHLNLFNNFTQSVPQGNTALLVIIMIFTLAIGAVFSIIFLQKDYLSRSRQRFKRLRKISLEAYITQLGFWLNLIQKKSPAFAFTMA